ncbi:anaerobic ribonucleoside-triphosphate reductase [Candidatus Bipolaricaulota bacterium]|nr:anaerobic ribonucleoside-triphosphate reductase [Candidatus Bipolaricaulota bacterium]
MPSTTCPVCGKGFRIDEDQALLYEQVSCPHCDANLEVIDESPVILEEIDG